MNHHQLPINLLIADDHQIITDGIAQLLRAEPTIGEIYTSRNGREAVDNALLYPIDCVIMDINMPELSGLEATRIIRKERPQIKIIVVSMLCDPLVVGKMLKAGADAFLNKDTGKAELLVAIEKVFNNERYVSPAISYDLFRQVCDFRAASTTEEKALTKRELEIVRHIADGLTNHEIAAKLFLSTVTVDTHRKNMLAKLRLKNTASLVKYAADHKLL